MNDTELREVGELKGLMQGMQRSLDEKHAENQRWQNAHDRLDTDNFKEVFSRLRTIENRNTIDDELEKDHARKAIVQARQETLTAQHRHNYITTFLTVSGMLVSALVTWWLTTHHF